MELAVGVSTGTMYPAIHLFWAAFKKAIGGWEGKPSLLNDCVTKFAEVISYKHGGSLLCS